MLKLLVIADDFTGALDTGVQFSSQGIPTLVSTETDVVYDAIPTTIEVLVLNTESRHLSFNQAYEKIRIILEDAKKAKIPFIYKKVDSALRGNISAEIKAILDTYEQEVIPFLPSYPEMNRVLMNGHLYIDDILVSESVFAEDPYEPVTESNVIRRLEVEAGIQATLVHDCQLPKIEKGVYVFDALTDETLNAQAVMLQEQGLLSLTIGCAGFARAIAKLLFPNRHKVTYNLEKPIVVICGSVNPITKKQIEYVEKKDYPCISLSATQLLEPEYWQSESGQREIAEYLHLMDNEMLIIFETLSEETTKGIKAYQKINELSIKECRFRIGASLGKLTEALWLKKTKNTFLFTGGDTLFQSMKVLDVRWIKPIAEIIPGVVLSVIEWNNMERQVITKSGGFGTEDLFEEISL
ncbi:uncharacterized protein YgbK (DUF1537 family) [Enterococcus sp. PF1-24]|uniref:four-carbon acid sugar kinase family protein n=1 Tax=unclassified Enterococcus TaxID=2608891 RepID=UPI002473C44F|nr:MULTISPECIES: four-carbon acid sugar kinase family protein [unclassified Enterococcus]MDH6363676.1 uncharacterized protein YgbK (DUF1537 family) [Enterococcus sp. PFB1-1]MDH6400632.1 uncharacterized protein YgbK (DUF1537 family) [Enterococcus sp. PF1-24]